MCGIGGVINYDKSSSQELLNKILSKIEHRGRFGTLYETYNSHALNFAIGTNRLPIVKPELNKQPAISPNSTIILVMNGEIFNYKDIALKLKESYGINFKDSLPGDTMILAAAIEQWGVDKTLKEITWEGVFVAIDLSTKRVFLARDHIGIKPLYYLHKNNQLFFASEIKALKDLTKQAIITQLDPGTFGIYNLEGDNSINIKSWWKPENLTIKNNLYVTNIKVKNNHAEYINSKELALENLVDQLLVYDVYDFDNKKIKLNRHGRAGDGGYVVPELAFEKADVLLGYGIADDISFEESFATIYNKPSFGFDCGVKDIKSGNKLCAFISECISSDKFLYSSQQSSTRVSSFSEQLKRLNLLDKKIFIKMDIEGAEYEAFKDIYKYSSQITGIAIEIHCDYMEWILKASSLLNHLSRNFYLVHVHPNNCCDHKADIFTVKNAKGKIPNVLELTFINKNLVKSAEISNNQHHPSSIDMQNCPENDSIEFELIVN